MTNTITYMSESGEESFSARARIMILLGEQLITDEVTAVSELIKNSYDADAPEVILTLTNVSDKEHGEVRIIDKGHGMTKDTLLNSWLQLGTISKHKKESEPARYSASGERLLLGEKGLGRLAVHKIGKTTEIITRYKGENVETKLILDWTEFENKDKFLGDIKNKWEVTEPKYFTKDTDEKFEHGTLIRITNLQRNWKSDTIQGIKEFVWMIKSPIVGLKNFKPEIKVTDPEDVELPYEDINDFLKSAHYEFVANINEFGIAQINYKFQSPVFKGLERTENIENYDLKQGKIFEGIDSTFCGEFKFTIYGWELDSKHKKETFGSGRTYDDLVKPQTGVKVYRDGFRVFPYGNEGNDWLDMDKSRIEHFQFNVSRNQIIGVIEISSKTNSKLQDKSDREGLIDNDAYRQFHILIASAIMKFQTLRQFDRSKMKLEKLTDPRKNKFAEHLQKLNKILEKEKFSNDSRVKIASLLDNTLKIFDDTMEEIEGPLLGAASVGLTYLLPTHELRRSVKESTKILKGLLREEKSENVEKIRNVIEHLQEMESIIRGITNLTNKGDPDEEFKLSTIANRALQLMNKKLERNKISYSIEGPDFKVLSNPRAIVLILMNMVDNSIYWLIKNKIDNRKLKIVIKELTNNYVLIVSDNGPGFSDKLEMITLPFYTTKVGGMGLGLFICKKICETYNLKLQLFEKNEINGLLEGANIGILFPKDAN